MAAVFAGKSISRFFSATLSSGIHVEINLISTSVAVTGGQRWRVRNGLAGDGLAYGPLTDLPDWSFVDGRSAPKSKGRKRRQNNRTRDLTRIMQYLKEVDGKESSDSRDVTNKT